MVDLLSPIVSPCCFWKGCFASIYLIPVVPVVLNQSSLIFPLALTNCSASFFPWTNWWGTMSTPLPYVWQILSFLYLLNAILSERPNFLSLMVNLTKMSKSLLNDYYINVLQTCQTTLLISFKGHSTRKPIPPHAELFWKAFHSVASVWLLNGPQYHPLYITLPLTFELDEMPCLAFWCFPPCSLDVW